MTSSLHRIGTTMIDRTLRVNSESLTALNIGSLMASGTNTVSPLSNAFLSSG